MSSKRKIEQLQQKQISAVIDDSLFRDLLEEEISEIIAVGKTATTEATVEGSFESRLYSLLRQFRISFNPEKEILVDSRRHTRKGRMDSKVGAVVIEYKHRSKLDSAGDNTKAISQIEDYLESLSKKSDTQYYGFLTDGIKCMEFMFQNGKAVSKSSFQSLGVDQCLRLIQNIVSLDKTSLLPENLIRDFCDVSNDKNLCYRIARELYEVLESHPTNKTKMLRAEWEQLFRLGHDDKSQQKRIIDRKKALEKIIEPNVENRADNQYAALFCLQTTYAILVKFIAYRIVSDLKFGKPLKDFRSQLDTDQEGLRIFCEDLEEGDIFRDLGIMNLLEGDFFSWYSAKSQWNANIAKGIREILETLTRYENAKQIFGTGKIVDLFKGLYEAIIPQIVRSSLGEFYTPEWLCEHVLRTVEPHETKWRGLDPCAGSGTFVIAMIGHVLEEISERSKTDQLNEVLDRVQAIDLNPLAVLTTRVNYFIRIAHLLPEGKTKIQIPVYLGDACYVPETTVIDDVQCLKYSIKTIEQPIDIILPRSLTSDKHAFALMMRDYEKSIRDKNLSKALQVLTIKLSKAESSTGVIENLTKLTAVLIDLEKKEWNGIWARIITNFLTTSNLGYFDIIIGNPPWIDWKNLPSGYRNRIKSLCIDKQIFSGDGRTGGINLNVCALITQVAIDNWLDKVGKLAFLMPKVIAFQQSYDGFRKFRSGTVQRSFLGFDDWSKAGHPFHPVQEKFMTYIIGRRKIGDQEVIPVREYVRKYGKKKIIGNIHLRYDDAMDRLQERTLYAAQVIPNNTAFTISKSKTELLNFRKIAGMCHYKAREGIEFYPQELLLFRKASEPPATPSEGCTYVTNIQVDGAIYKVPTNTVELETKYLFPLVKAVEIKKFGLGYSGIVVPFPYQETDYRRPLDMNSLEETSPNLLRYYRKYRKMIESQTEFSDKIRGEDAGEFYGLARVGRYSFAKYHVAFRDNTKWCACVVAPKSTFWGEEKIMVFQNHATSICEDAVKKKKSEKPRFITEDEAHYICAILNAPIVEKFILQSSDERSFKIRPPVKIPRYDNANPKHKLLVSLSKQAHRDTSKVVEILPQVDEAYLALVSEQKEDSIDNYS